MPLCEPSFHSCRRPETITLDAGCLEGITNTALFYPCCGQDLDLPVRLFASAVSDFYFVAIRKPRRPRPDELAAFEPRDQVPGTDTFMHRPSGHFFHLHRWER